MNPTKPEEKGSPARKAQEAGKPAKRAFPIHGVRTAFRGAVLALFLFDCVRLLLLYWWANGVIDMNLGRPQLSAGLSPLSGLFDLRAWAASGKIDPVLPASMVIVILGLASSLFAKRSFCSWMCPVGTVLDAFDFIGRKIFPGIHLSERAVSALRIPKMVFGAVVLIAVIFVVPVSTVLMAWQAPYWSVSDMAVLKLFVQPGAAIIAVAAVVLGLSLLLGRNFWCSSLCPLGAIYGALSMASPLTVKRDASKCTGCGACAKACPAHIHVDVSSASIRSYDCTGCMECVGACPQRDALRPKLLGKASVPVAAIPILVFGIWMAVWGIAIATGNWYGHAGSQWITQALQVLGSGII